jgi:hypothetical protein
MTYDRKHKINDSKLGQFLDSFSGLRAAPIPVFFLGRQGIRTTKRNFKYGKELCLLVGGSAMARHEER